MEMDLAEQFFLGLAFKSAMRCFRSMVCLAESMARQVEPAGPGH
ncbi:hypothetical protein ACVWZ3_010638 [Bradyrhizobium sp. i1.3.6]